MRIIFLQFIHLLIVVFFSYVLIHDAPRPLNVEKFGLLKNGMSQKEVEKLLGGPPGNYGRYGYASEMTLEKVIVPPGSVLKTWCNDSNSMELYFDKDGILVNHHKRHLYGQAGRKGPAWANWLQDRFMEDSGH